MKHLALSAPALLVLTGCGADGLGDTDALEGMEVHYTEEGAPEVLLNSPVEAEEESSRVISDGDGDDVDPDQILEVSSAMVDPESGEVQDETFTAGQPSLLHLPTIREQNEFIFDALTESDLGVGGEVALYEPADEEAMSPESLIVLRIDGQIPAYAQGEEVEQSGDLPAIDSVEGEAPDLEEAPGEDEDAPEDTVSEVIIEGEGDEVQTDDQLAVQYTGWRWSDGEVFDSSWPIGQQEAQGEEGDAERDDVGQPTPFMLDQVIDGWTSGLEGKSVGDRVVLVIPPEEAYGDSEGNELQDETLIFVVDIVAAVDVPEQPEGEGQPEEGPEQAPDESDLSEEELEQLEELQEQLEEEQGGGDSADADENDE
ncbi:MAG: FKBP-type peptidyl-prolyl cis-trans isomerase [Nesterenkonia sp.]|uniref:FKBP-type peptidyl-prolyl cis-trans isomerase n=1 Tax=Nesterenkonia marinintestina TaxID=2979865 RepID=UPI0021BEFD35|nr:FKBP-type peptidyl-prolyl cis-trans isomerase [Nesterenkonia sp. GX14115]MDO5492113.1 FKBP-type peptidyl-prolyl cis-trans isomerase [Nesterenkonia sp.]